MRGNKLFVYETAAGKADKIIFPYLFVLEHTNNFHASALCFHRRDWGQTFVSYSSPAAGISLPMDFKPEDIIGCRIPLPRSFIGGIQSRSPQ